MPVSAADLRALTGSTKTDTELALFLSQGQLVVDEFLVDSGLTDAVKNSIALYLSGHYYVLSVEGGGITYARAGQSEERYKSFGFDIAGFGTTRFGTMAIAMDVTGKLMEMSSKTKTGFGFESFSAPRSKPKNPVDMP